MSPIEPNQLPEELINLLALHSSFLTALSLHYAHNGTSTPADLRDLVATTTSVWRHRKVTYDDIRIILAILDDGPSGHENPYFLSDYGRGKICLEIKENSPLMSGMTNVHEHGLQEMFKAGLETLWSKWTNTRNISNRPIAMPKRGRGRPKRVDNKQARLEPFLDEACLSSFLAQLPLAEITTCSSLTAIAPLQEKGRKRLRDFKDSVQQGRTQKKTRQCSGKENEPAVTETQQQAKITEFAAVRKTNLLDRIIAKQEAAKAGPVAPSPAELQRMAALQRAPDILSVLQLLCASRPGARVSFSTNTLIQSLQGSFRMPLSKEEAMKCVEVLASEVAPGYVSLITMGSISSVVVVPAMRPMDLKSRLASLSAA